MNFIKFTILSVLLFSSCSIFQASEANSGIHVNHEKWLQYSRALPESLNSHQILNARNIFKTNTPPCMAGSECPPSNGARRSHLEEAETPMSMLVLNLTDIEIPFKVVKDVLHLDQRDETKGKFVTEKAVIFSFVNRTVLRNIKNAGKIDPNEDPMITALFLPVEYRFNKDEGKTVAYDSKASKPVQANQGGKDSEWPQFFQILLKEMAASNVTSQNLVQALMSNVGGTEAGGSETPSMNEDYSEAMKLIKDHAFQDTDVMLYFFRTPHVGFPQKFMSQVLKDANIPLASNSESKFEVNEVYLMTVANETAGNALKSELENEDGSFSREPSSTPVVLSFIIPIEFNSDRRRRALPRVELASSPPQFVPLRINNPAFAHGVPLAPIPAFSLPVHFVPLPLMIPYQLGADSDWLIDSESEEDLNNVDQEQPIWPMAKGSSDSAQGTAMKAQAVQHPHRYRKPVVAAPSVNIGASSYEYQSQKAPPATAPGGITSSLQP